MRKWKTDLDNDGIKDNLDCNKYLSFVGHDADGDNICDYYLESLNVSDYPDNFPANDLYNQCRQELEDLREYYDGSSKKRPSWCTITELQGDPCKLDNCVRYTPDESWTGNKWTLPSAYSTEWERWHAGGLGNPETVWLKMCYKDDGAPTYSNLCKSLWYNPGQSDMDGDGLGDVCDSDISAEVGFLGQSDRPVQITDEESAEFEYCMQECGEDNVRQVWLTGIVRPPHMSLKTSGMEIVQEWGNWKLQPYDDLAAVGACECDGDLNDREQCIDDYDGPCRKYTEYDPGIPGTIYPFYRRFDSKDIVAANMMIPFQYHENTNQGTLVLYSYFADTLKGNFLRSVSFDNDYGDNSRDLSLDGYGFNLQHGDFFGMRFAYSLKEVQGDDRAYWNEKRYYVEDEDIDPDYPTVIKYREPTEADEPYCICKEYGIIPPIETRTWPRPATRFDNIAKTRVKELVNEVKLGMRVGPDGIATQTGRYDGISGQMSGVLERTFVDGTVDNVALASFGTATGSMPMAFISQPVKSSSINNLRDLFNGCASIQRDVENGEWDDDPVFINVLYGGELQSGELSDDLWVSVSHPDLAQAEDKWFKVVSADESHGPALRDPRTAYISGQNRLYVLGGRTSDNLWNREIHFFDLCDWKWHEAGTVNVVPFYSDYDVLYDNVRGDVILFGGYFFFYPTLLAYRFNPSSGQFSIIPQWGIPGINMPWPRKKYSVALRENTNSLVLFGGNIGRNGDYQNDTWSLDLATGYWTRLDDISINLPEIREYAALLPGQGDTLHMVGGRSFNRDIVEPAWTLGGGGVKGWKKTSVPLVLNVNDPEGAEGTYDGSVDMEYLLGIGSARETEARAVKVHLLDDGDGYLNIVVMNEFEEVVAQGARVTIGGSSKEHPVAAFMALPGVSYTVRVVFENGVMGQDSLPYRLVASYATPEHRSTKWHFPTGGFHVDQGYLWVTSMNALHAYGIENDGTLSDLTSIPMSMPQDVTGDGRYIYTADRERGLIILDPYAANGDGTYSLSLGGRMCYSITKHGDKLYLAMGWMGIDIIDVTDPTNPRLISNRFTGDFAYRVNVYGNKLIVSDFMHGIDIFHIKRGGRLKYTSSHRTSGYAMDTRGHGVNLYVENLATSMEIVSLGDLENPVTVREYQGYNVPIDAQLWGNTSVVHIDGVGVASFELIDDLAAVPFLNN